MKEYIEVQKNIAALITPIVLGLCFTILGIVIISKVSIVIGLIFTFSIIIGILTSIIVLVKNFSISKVRIDKKGVTFKEKSGLKLIFWDDFINCNVKHKGRGVYKIILNTKENSFYIIHEINVVEKLIEFCTSQFLIEILKTQKSNS